MILFYFSDSLLLQLQPFRIGFNLLRTKPTTRGAPIRFRFSASPAAQVRPWCCRTMSGAARARQGSGGSVGEGLSFQALAGASGNCSSRKTRLVFIILTVPKLECAGVQPNARGSSQGQTKAIAPTCSTIEISKSGKMCSNADRSADQRFSKERYFSR
jgi:hypothetical protein